MYQNTENVLDEIKEYLVVSAHEINLQASFSRHRKYSFEI